MTRVFIADARVEERSALRLLLTDLDMEVVGEATDWYSTMTGVPLSRADMLLVDWDLLPAISSTALKELRQSCRGRLVIIIISYLDARQQATLSSGADVFISKGEAPERIADRLRFAAANISVLIQLADKRFEIQNNHNGGSNHE